MKMIVFSVLESPIVPVLVLVLVLASIAASIATVADVAALVIDSA
eukprot:CAMPEP_0204626590 /NCGR_PEP_ID=MMETSP0717-20131115/12374_1 /ASSEMBLY_ACC=CAM_ASM_000666 /TAXON_ID=230516 /ORGANISM="Chaetoceros curvisetus" /LENGTH=44 /DNA_ID= /DNA_START= /DNA_END= /DNA_ORIENTATION=